MNRRAFVLGGTGAAIAVVAAPYAPLVVGDQFEEFVAGTLGMDPQVASQLLRGLREQLGGTEYDERAATFSIAFRGPWAGAVPDGLRRSAVERFVGPLFSAPPDRLAYVEDRAPVRACGGLRRPS